MCKYLVFVHIFMYIHYFQHQTIYVPTTFTMINVIGLNTKDINFKVELLN